MTDTPDTPDTPDAADTPEPEPKGPTPGGKRRKSSGTRSSSTNRGGRPTKNAERARRVSALYEQLGGMAFLGAVIDPRFMVVGSAMVEHSDDLGAAWAQWADTSPRVARIIDGMSMTGGAIGVALAHVPLVTALLRPAPLGDLGDTEGAGNVVSILAGMMGAADT